MNNSVKTRPQRRLTQAELDAFLEKAADLLRGGVVAAIKAGRIMLDQIQEHIKAGHDFAIETTLGR